MSCVLRNKILKTELQLTRMHWNFSWITSFCAVKRFCRIFNSVYTHTCSHTYKRKHFSITIWRDTNNKRCHYFVLTPLFCSLLCLAWLCLINTCLNCYCDCCCFWIPMAIAFNAYQKKGNWLLINEGNESRLNDFNLQIS